MSRKRKSIDRGVIIVGRDSTAKVSDEDFDLLNGLAWNMLKGGYAITRIDHNSPLTSTLMHRLVYERMSGNPCVQGMVIDHIDRDRLNNQRENLRSVTPSINNHNRAKKKVATSRYIGVSASRGGQWNAACQRESKRFKTETAAAYYYDQLAVQHFGAHANINGIDRPLDFDDAMVTGVPRNAAEDRCIKSRGAKSVVHMKVDGVSISRTCDTIEEAREWRDAFNKRMRESKQAEMQAREITRNADGIAFVATGGKIKANVLVDDDVWRSLQGAPCNLGSDGYARTKLLGIRQLVHVFVMNRLGAKDGLVIDHINHDRIDNRRCNLRVVTFSTNAHNKNVKGQYVGIKKQSRRWSATISCQKRTYCLGTFPTAKEAAVAYNTKAIELYGSEARLNVIE